MTNNQIVSIVERIESLELQKAEIAADISDIYKEAKGNGFDAKILRKVVAARKKSKEERSEEEAIFDLYMSALGQLSDTPLGQAALSTLKVSSHADFD